MKKAGSSNAFGGVDFLFSSLLFLMFVLCSVFTILIGSRVYENIRARDDGAFYSDTALAYITNKVRQADSFDSVSLRNESALPDSGEILDSAASLDSMTAPDGGVQVLVLSSVSDGIVYETWIYYMDGVLKELYTEKDSGLTINDGLDIMECPPFAFSIEDAGGGRLLTISLGESQKPARILLRSGNSEKGGQ